MDWTLPAGGEFRFEVDLGSAVSVRLLPEPNDPSKGRAECMGMELAPGVDYTVSGPAKCAIFSYDGCRLLVTPENLENKNKSNSTIKGCSVEYVSCENEGAMHAYLNTHRALETLRDELESPLKVLILGTGRNTVARILTNYAIRMGRTILLTDVDPSSGSVLIPGTIAAHQITRPLSLIDGWWGASAGDGQPIAYFYGSTTGILQEESSSGSTGSSTKARKNHYKKICSRLAHAIDSRLTNEFSSKTSDKNNKHGGIIIVGPADADESTGEDLRSIFNPQLTLVVGNERLHATLEKVFFKKQIENDQKKTFTVLKLPRPSGVVTKDAPYRRAQIQAQFARFFYGPSHEYSPMNVNISFDDVSIRRLSDSSEFDYFDHIFYSPTIH